MRSGGRVVEGARLESEYTAKPYRGFESLPLRHSPEREREGLHAGVEEGDREGAVADRALLPDKLVEPLPVDLAAAVDGVVDSRILTRRPSVERNLEAHRLAGRRTKHEV